MIKPNDINESTEIWIGDRRFYGIEELGFNEEGHFVLSLYTTEVDNDPRRGEFYSGLPISPKEYRREKPTKAAAEVSSVNTVIIYDDYGKPTPITICDRKIFDRLIDELGEAELLRSILGYSRQQIINTIKFGYPI